MAKRKVTFDDYEGQQFEDYTGEDPKVGAWYTGEVVRIKDDDEQDQLIFFVQIVDHPDYEGWTRGYYGPFEGNQKWKLQDMLKALQGGQEKAVELDWANEKAVALWLKKTKRFRFQVGEYNEKLQVRKVRTLLNAVGATKATSAKATAAPAPAEPDEEEVEDYTQEELEALTDDELEAILQDEFEFSDDELPELTPRQKRADKDGSKYKAALVEAILAEQEPEEDEAESDEADTDANADDPEFEDGFDDGSDPEPEPEPPARTRRTRAAAAPAKAAPAKAAPAARRGRRS